MVFGCLFRKIGREDKEAQAILLKLEPHKALSQRMEHLKHVMHLEDVLKSFFYLEDANIFLWLLQGIGHRPSPIYVQKRWIRTCMARFGSMICLPWSHDHRWKTAVLEQPPINRPQNVTSNALAWKCTCTAIKNAYFQPCWQSPVPCGLKCKCSTPCGPYLLEGVLSMVWKSAAGNSQWRCLSSGNSFFHSLSCFRPSIWSINWEPRLFSLWSAVELIWIPHLHLLSPEGVINFSYTQLWKRWYLLISWVINHCLHLSDPMANCLANSSLSVAEICNTASSGLSGGTFVKTAVCTIVCIVFCASSSGSSGSSSVIHRWYPLR